MKTTTEYLSILRIPLFAVMMEQKKYGAAMKLAYLP